MSLAAGGSCLARRSLKAAIASEAASANSNSARKARKPSTHELSLAAVIDSRKALALGAASASIVRQQVVEPTLGLGIERKAPRAADRGDRVAVAVLLQTLSAKSSSVFGSSDAMTLEPADRRTDGQPGEHVRGGVVGEEANGGPAASRNRP